MTVDRVSVDGQPPHHTYIHTYKHTYMHTYIQYIQYMHAYKHTNIHTYKHTYIQTYIHTCCHAYTYLRINPVYISYNIQCIIPFTTQHKAWHMAWWVCKKWQRNDLNFRCYSLVKWGGKGETHKLSTNCHPKKDLYWSPYRLHTGLARAGLADS